MIQLPARLNLQLRQGIACILIFLSLIAATQETNIAERSDEPTAETSDISITKAAAGLNKRKHTALEIDQFWRRLSKNEVRWRGTVIEVRDLDKNKVLFLQCPGLDGSQSYNVIVKLVPDADLVGVYPGADIPVAGRLLRYMNHKGRPDVFVLTNARLLKNRDLPEEGDKAE